VGRSSQSSSADAAAAAALATVAPLCFGHQDPSKVVVVKKTGPNKGRRFFACCRPREDQCDFFMYTGKTKRTGFGLSAAARSGARANSLLVFGGFCLRVCKVACHAPCVR
jgi:hypothetical protein